MEIYYYLTKQKRENECKEKDKKFTSKVFEEIMFLSS